MIDPFPICGQKWWTSLLASLVTLEQIRTRSGLFSLANDKTLEHALMINWPSNAALPQCILESLDLLHHNRFGERIGISSSSMQSHVHKKKAIDIPLRTIFDPQVNCSLPLLRRSLWGTLGGYHDHHAFTLLRRFYCTPRASGIEVLVDLSHQLITSGRAQGENSIWS